MATRARFGRLPRSAPSLTSTIVSLAQQYQGQRDRNIEDAWKNGGLFEGHKVTDQFFLKHWKQRLAGVSQDDPMWDYYNNMIHTYDFEIEESKMGQKYAEEKVGDGQMAAFYRKWASKMPKDSEGYRRLMTQAAKFRAAAGARGRGRGARSSAQAYQNKQMATYNKNEAPYDLATSLIAKYAESRNILDKGDLDDPDGGWSKLTNAGGENDPYRLAALLVDLQADPGISKYMTDLIRQYDPSFSGNFNISTLTALANNARNGATIRMHRAQAAGLKGDTTAARKAMDNYSTSSTIIAVTLGKPGEASFVEQNEHYRALLDAALAEDSGSSPMEKATAIQQYQDWLTNTGAPTLARTLPAGSLDPRSNNFNPTATGIYGRIEGTLAALRGEKGAGQTLKDDLLAQGTQEAGESSDAATLSEAAADNRFIMDNIANGNAIVVRTSGTGKNQVPDPKGNNWTAFARDAPEVAGNDDLIPVPVSAHGTYTSSDGKYTMGGREGEVRYTVATALKVRQTAYQDQATGAFTGAVKPWEGMDETIGKQVDITGPGGQTITVYGTYQNGALVWSTINPLVGIGTDGAPARTIDADGSVVYTYSARQQPVSGPKAAGAPKLGYNPQDYVNSAALTSPDTKANWNYANDKQTAFSSPIAALANSSSEHMKYVATEVGADAVKKAETEWYSDPKKWTASMRQDYGTAIAGGVRPEDAAAAVVDRQSTQLVNTIQFNLNYGYTPEQQSNTRAALKLRAETEAATRQGLSLAEFRRQGQVSADTAARDDLVAKLGDWGVSKEQQKIPGMYATSGMMGANYIPGQTVAKPSQLPKGWSAGDLLSQPGMSLTAANDLAYRISKGAVGTPFSYAGGTTQQWPLIPGAQPVTVTKPGENPFMPRPGQTPRPKPYGGYAPPTARPVQGPPKPVAPRPAPKPRQPDEDRVNPYTGFTVPKASATLPKREEVVFNKGGR